ncbi:Acetylcholine receptor subunit beta-like 2 [Sarcoptes scabiei]|uniref:Acetylcholine receptor subunit beta-like 2 n=2 Tax=Sarcoptes scabiei TaxID=52283 RepID=A0A834R9S1_SARSC|nr:Acetylcholine receptor subunit beta-like 2 [Sarcoptes scabiei]UXI19031.1 metastasis suppressor protein 1 [Sarcoptes scabiei]
MFVSNEILYRLIVILFPLLFIDIRCRSHSPTKRLHDDLFSDYNRLIRPSKNHSYKLTVNIGLKLTQIIDINLRQQVMTTNIWLEQNWYDYKLTWDPKDYGGVDMINVPAESIWLPDIVLFNNADGNYEVTLMTKATVYNTGLVVWNPPALYKSTCKIDVQYFPFDEQSCLMKFASWTYDGHEVDIRHVKQEEGSTFVEVGIDLSEFYKSVEWDILRVSAKYNEEYYECCPEPYPDITFNLTMRRKTLFYTVNLIIPCVGITFLTLVVFYLPSDSGEKVTLSISILVALTVFFLLLAEIIPPTSLAIPLLGKYLLFTMILDTLSICVTVYVLNVHFRSPSTHIMTPWVRKVFIHILPKILLMKRPSSQDWHAELEAIGKKNRNRSKKDSDDQSEMGKTNRIITKNPKSLCKADSIDSYQPQTVCNEPVCFSTANHNHQNGFYGYSSQQLLRLNHLNEQNYSNLRQIFAMNDVQKAIKGIIHLADHIRRDDEDNNIIEDWKYVAMVLDRLFLWMFSLAVFCGTCGIILQAPSLYDKRVPIEAESSSLAPVSTWPFNQSENNRATFNLDSNQI